MQKGNSKAIVLPDNLKIEYVQGKPFMELKAAAKLAGIHPVILEMGRKLLEHVGGARRAVPAGHPEIHRTR